MLIGVNSEKTNTRLFETARTQNCPTDKTYLYYGNFTGGWFSWRRNEFSRK